MYVGASTNGLCVMFLRVFSDELLSGRRLFQGQLLLKDDSAGLSERTPQDFLHELQSGAGHLQELKSGAGWYLCSGYDSPFLEDSF